MSTLLSSTAGVSRPGNAATEHETYIPMAYRKSKRAHTQDDDETWVDDGIANTVNLFDQGDTRTTHAVVQPIPLDSMNIFRSPEADASTGCGLGEEGEAMFTLTKTNHHAVAQPLNIYGGNKRSDRPEGGFYVRMNEDTSKTLDATSGLNPTANQGGTAVMQPVVFQETADPLTACFAKHHGASGGKDSIPHNHVMQSMAVRRLTPRECERLQGFSDDHTLIPWRGKDASQCPDGPRYKALGNSMAVPVMAWIGERIRMVCELQK
jgi:site-specific DNA-cytosine methylase